MLKKVRTRLCGQPCSQHKEKKLANDNIKYISLIYQFNYNLKLNIFYILYNFSTIKLLCVTCLAILPAALYVSFMY